MPVLGPVASSFVAPCMLLVVMNIGLNHVECGEDRTLSTDLALHNIVDVLTDLIDNYTYVMDLQVDSELYNATLSRFESMLNLVSNDHREHPLPAMSGLLHLALLGAYKVQCHTVKDKLSKGHESTLEDGDIISIAPWSTQLLQYLLDYNMVDINNSSRFELLPLELAIKLQNLEAAEMITQRGGTVCESYTPLKCSNALHYAIINNNLRDLTYILSSIKADNSNQTSNTNLSSSITDSLISDTQAYDSTFAYPPLQVSFIHCLIGFSCSMYSYLSSHLSLAHEQLSLPSRMLHSQICSVMDTGVDIDVRRWYVSSNQVSGWRVYNGFHIGRSNGCDLPRINVHDDNFLEEFERVFVDLGVPVVIGGVTNKWPLQYSWKKQPFVKNWSEIDLLVGAIPYGEVFGETFGYATVHEFVSYMDQYALSPAVNGWSGNGTFQAPLYVFDSEVLKEHFVGQYSLNGLLVPALQSATQYHQFILGPAGSGAPFHFHCHALNALVFGRKKWFLYPPANKVYSKQHPLLWYTSNYSQLTNKPAECVQHAGEVLYVPAMWSHATVNLDESIGLAVEFDTGDC